MEIKVYQIRNLSANEALVYLGDKPNKLIKGDSIVVWHGSNLRMVFGGNHYIVECVVNNFAIDDGFELKAGIHCGRFEVYACLKKFKARIATVTSAGAGGAAFGALGPTAAVAAVQGLGFSTGGVVAGSTAASMMSSAGVVQAGSVVAGLQSIGAIGALSGGALVAVGAGAALLGATAVGGIGYGIYKLLAKDEDCYADCKKLVTTN
eukprot:TRINITY_DN7735_c0_g1_i1.p1 TRINITY_DN7735_c0_g1~~TRINITY_DN7735_c0_g1_i1.p1  ORF type:complete len:207 (+),score=20.49 TRINITY_DN7735_c0_g1_i1:27-647(+)